MDKMNILVTGGCGFIGTNFIRNVIETRPNWYIINIDALTYAGNAYNVDDISKKISDRYHFIHGDICDRELLKSIFCEKKIEAVVHFAAESHVDKSIIGPEAFVETNVFGTFRLLEASLENWKNWGKPDSFRFLHVSTDEVYGSLGKDGYFTEQTPYDPSSPYSASKASSDHFVNAYYRTYYLPTLITNCSNNYGPFQFPEKLIPLIILNMLEEKPLPVYGDGRNVRDWLYVIDHCEALIRVLESGKPGETYNIGGGTEKQNIEIVQRLCDLMDKRLERKKDNSGHNLIQFVSDRPGHDRRYAIDASKIRSELGWSPRFTFDTALEETVEWYMNHMEWVEYIMSGEYKNWIEANYSKRESI